MYNGSMKKSIVVLLLGILLLEAALPFGAARAEADANAADAGSDYYLTPSAANAARMLREGDDSAALAYWTTAEPHPTGQYRLKKAMIAMLKNTVGFGLTPVGSSGICFRSCDEVPLMATDEKLQQRLDFNIHGCIYTSSPLLSVCASFAPRGGSGKGVTETVTFDPLSEITSYSLCSEAEPIVGKSLDTLFDISALPEGAYRFTLTASTVDQASPVMLAQTDCSIVREKRLVLTQNKFDDNYTEASAFFNGDTNRFLFHYSIKADRSIATENDWRDACIVKSSLGRVHIDAVPYFEEANEYLVGTYVCVSIVNPRSGKVSEGRVTQLKKLMPDYATYVPRFQTNLEYLSHHTLGTCIDVNDTLYPNLNILSNHELIGTEVRDNLVYNGIKTNDKGVSYYDFTYTGEYPRQDRFPKTILNYLLYELAFFRAGFFWGYYYETACDGMHFTLSENDPNMFMHSDIGLRKIYEYCPLQVG